MVSTVCCVIIFVSCAIITPTGLLPVGPTFKHAWAAAFFPCTWRAVTSRAADFSQEHAWPAQPQASLSPAAWWTKRRRTCKQHSCAHHRNAARRGACNHRSRARSFCSILLHFQNVLPSATLYYKACTKYFPVLLRSTKLAQILSSTISHCKDCANYFPVLLSTTKHPFTRKNTMFRANPNIQIASMMQQFQCNPPRMICKTQSESQDSTAEKVPFDQRWRWRSHSIAICRHWVATHKKITYNGYTICSYLQLQNRISTPKRKNDDFEAILTGQFKEENHQCQNCKNLLPKQHSQLSRRHCNAIYATQLQNTIVLRLQLPAAATAQRRTLTQPIPLRLADAELQNTIELCTEATQIVPIYACSCSSEEPWRSHSTAICRHWVAKHNRITHNGCTNCSYLQLQNRISTPKRKKADFETLFWREFQKENH